MKRTRLLYLAVLGAAALIFTLTSCQQPTSSTSSSSTSSSSSGGTSGSGGTSYSVLDVTYSYSATADTAQNGPSVDINFSPTESNGSPTKIVESVDITYAVDAVAANGLSYINTSDIYGGTNYYYDGSNWGTLVIADTWETITETPAYTQYSGTPSSASDGAESITLRLSGSYGAADITDGHIYLDKIVIKYTDGTSETSDFTSSTDVPAGGYSVNSDAGSTGNTSTYSIETITSY